MKTRIHTTPAYFFNPVHPITITVIGAGGNGSMMIPRLARMDYALSLMGHPGLLVRVIDNDIVEPFNVGRQQFTLADIGSMKSTNIVSKANRAYQLQWEAIPKRVEATDPLLAANIIITCVDNAQFREDFATALQTIGDGTDMGTNYYWLDMGNSKNHAQFIIGTNASDGPDTTTDKNTIVKSLSTVYDLFPNMVDTDTLEIQGNSCSYEDKLAEQSLFINDIVSSHASDLLFKLLKDKVIFNHGGFINTETGRVNPMPV